MRQRARGRSVQRLSWVVACALTIAVEARQAERLWDVETDGLVALIQKAITTNETTETRSPRRSRLSAGDEVLDGLVDRLHRSMGASATRLPPQETLVALDSDGTVVGVTRGTEREAVLDAVFTGLLRRRGTRIILVHNHPRGASLSVADLGQLAEPGVEAIIAVGNDGSIYAATAGPAFDARTFERWLCPLARSAVERQLRVKRPSQRSDSAGFDWQFEHLVALALQRAGAIRYRALLVGAREASFAERRVVCGHVIESVGASLRDELRRQKRGRS